jgi:hypothetical protein
MLRCYGSAGGRMLLLRLRTSARGWQGGDAGIACRIRCDLFVERILQQRQRFAGWLGVAGQCRIAGGQTRQLAYFRYGKLRHVLTLIKRKKRPAKVCGDRQERCLQFG